MNYGKMALITLLAAGMAGINQSSAGTWGDFTYIVTGGTIKITGYTGAGGQVVIPEKITDNEEDKPVTAIDDSVFANCTGLTGVTIPGSVNSIGESAFSGCVNLTGITIPDSVTTLGSAVFFGCTKLASATLSSGLTTLPGLTFYQCTSLTSVTIPENVTEIGWSTFGFCSSLTSLTIPGNVTTIGGRAFYGCTGLSGITLPAGLTTLGSGAFYGCTGLTGITIPAGVAVIEDSVFHNCTGLTSVTIQEGVTAIGEYMFRSCTGLTSIIMPASIASIESWAFLDCANLLGVYFRGNAPAHGAAIFENAENVTVYYKRGTTGWGATYAGRPTALWDDDPGDVVQVTGVAITPQVRRMFVIGDIHGNPVMPEEQLVYAPIPANATISEVILESLNPDVIRIDSDPSSETFGLMTATTTAITEPRPKIAAIKVTLRSPPGPGAPQGTTKHATAFFEVDHALWSTFSYEHLPREAFARDIPASEFGTLSTSVLSDGAWLGEGDSYYGHVVVFYWDQRANCADYFIFDGSSSKLHIGDVVSTLDGWARIHLRDLTTFEMKPHSAIRIGSERHDKSKLSLLAGTVWGNLQRMWEDGSMDIEMSQAVAGIKGTTFVLEEDPEVSSTVKVLDGLVEVSSPDGSMVVEVRAGEKTTATNDGLGALESFSVAEEQTNWPEWEGDDTPMVFISAMGVRGMTTTLTYPEKMVVKVSAQAGRLANAGVPVDWFAVAIPRGGATWFYLHASGEWVAFPANQLQYCRPALMAPFVSTPKPVVILENYSPPPGIYDLYFAIDHPMDGFLNMIDGQWLYDMKTIVVQ